MYSWWPNSWVFILDTMAVTNFKNIHKQGQEEPLPDEGPINKTISEGDVIYWEIETREIWVKWIIIMKSKDDSWNDHKESWPKW